MPEVSMISLLACLQLARALNKYGSSAIYCSLENFSLLPGHWYRTSVSVWACIHASAGMIQCMQFSICVVFIISIYILFALQINIEVTRKFKSYSYNISLFQDTRKILDRIQNGEEYGNQKTKRQKPKLNLLLCLVKNAHAVCL